MTRTVILFPAPAERRPFLPIDWRQYLHVMRWISRHGEGVLAFLVLAVIVSAIVFAGQITIHDPTGSMNLANRFVPPFWEAGGSLTHPLGTDNMGRDIFSRVLHGGKVSLEVALTASTIATLVGVVIGLAGGFIGGWLDRIFVVITDMWVSFPFLVLALAVIAEVGSSPRTLIILLSLAGWVYSARVTRAQALKIRELDYVKASHAFGATRLHIIRHHVLPGVLNINIVLWTFAVSNLILIEGSLSFLGLGVSPPTPSWGNMLNEGKTYMQEAWWMSVFPGLALMLTVLCVNSAGDALQKLNFFGK